MRKGLVSVGIVALTAMIACDDDAEVDGDDVGVDVEDDMMGDDLSGDSGDSNDGMDGAYEVAASFTGLEELGEGFVYEGWAIVEGVEPISLGRFSGADGSHDPYPLTAEQVAGLASYVLTIEPDPDDSAGAAETKLLGGDFGDDLGADLSIGHTAALGSDYTEAGGTFVLRTPSSSASDDNEYGIWWLDDSGDGPVESLDLPDAPPGWAYEGWVVSADTGPISTGTFTTVSGLDSDEAGDYAGDLMAGPPYPGQDFIPGYPDSSFAGYNLVGFDAVISIEPVPDDNPAVPFVLKPLVGTITADTGNQAHINAAADTSPVGVATLQLAE